MLEKIILYVVAYFCVGTEIRFQATKLEKKESPQEYIKVWSSEMWHGKSLQVACMFLPEDCPLVDHIIKSYKKHYIGKQSLLSVVVQPRPRNKQPLQVALKSTTEQQLMSSQRATERPASQQQLSVPKNEMSSEKIRIRQKSPSNQGERSVQLSHGSGEKGGFKNRLSLQAQQDVQDWTRFQPTASEEEGPSQILSAGGNKQIAPGVAANSPSKGKA